MMDYKLINLLRTSGRSVGEQEIVQLKNSASSLQILVDKRLVRRDPAGYRWIGS